MHIPFNKPYLSGKELDYIRQAHADRHLSGNGPFTKKCHEWIEKHTTSQKALLTHSCTAALEMTALLLDIQPGDEIIMPSYTFVSTANAFVLRGGVPVFVDIRSDTLNLDESKIEVAITPRTRAIVVVHYAGVACEMDSILDLARRYGLRVIEDAAQGIGSQYKDRPLGSLGEFGTLSFHETKNVISGEGGALLINDGNFVEKAQIFWEKGTNREKFLKGEVDKYTWVDMGSSFLPNEITAAFLWAQLEMADDILSSRMALWQNYHHAFKSLESKERLRRPVIPPECRHNAHLYYLLLPSSFKRDTVLSGLNQAGINAIFHYVPLHNSPAGRKYGRVAESMENTETLSSGLLRLPLWLGLEEEQSRVIEEVIRLTR